MQLLVGNIIVVLVENIEHGNIENLTVRCHLFSLSKHIVTTDRSLLIVYSMSMKETDVFDSDRIHSRNHRSSCMIRDVVTLDCCFLILRHDQCRYHQNEYEVGQSSQFDRARHDQ
jgi:hypothetical protein